MLQVETTKWSEENKRQDGEGVHDKGDRRLQVFNTQEVGLERRERVRVGMGRGRGAGQNTDTDMKTDVRTKLRFVELAV